MSLSLYLPTRWTLTTPDLAGGSNVWPLLLGQDFIKRRTFSWSTGIQRAVSGRELRTANYSAPIHGWEVDINFLHKRASTDTYSQLVAFVNSQRGQFSAWYYFDPTDNLVTGQVFGSGDGVTTAFQLTRNVVSPSGGGPTFTEPVYALNGAPMVLINGVATTAFTVANYGAVIFSAPPPSGAVLSWSGSFLFPCRFTSDDFELKQEFAKIWSASSIAWQSIKP